MGPCFEGGFFMVLERVYHASGLAVHTRGPKDLLWKVCPGLCILEVPQG